MLEAEVTRHLDGDAGDYMIHKADRMVTVTAVSLNGPKETS